MQGQCDREGLLGQTNGSLHPHCPSPHFPATSLHHRRFEIRAPSKLFNRLCAPATVCAADEYEEAPLRATQDRICRPVNDCVARFEYETVPPTRTSDRVCQPLTVCRWSEYEVGATLRCRVIIIHSFGALWPHAPSSCRQIVYILALP